MWKWLKEDVEVPAWLLLAQSTLLIFIGCWALAELVAS